MSTTDAINFACQKCNQHLSIEAEHIGQTIECPACKALITVPKPTTIPTPRAMQRYGNSAAQTNSAVGNPKGLILGAWLMIGVTCLVSLIPGIGFATWLIAAPVLLITFILGIVALTKGATTQGILILLASAIAAPVFLFVAPIVTTATAAVGGAAATAAVSNEIGREAESSSPPSGPKVMDEAVPKNTKSLETTNQTQRTKGKSFTINDIVDFDDSSWVVLSARELGSSIKNTNMGAEDLDSEGKFIYVKYKVTNNKKEEESIAFTPSVRDSKGRRYEELVKSEMYLPEGETGITMEALPASLSKTFSAIFEVPKDSTGIVFLARSFVPFKAEEKAIVLNLEEAGTRGAIGQARSSNPSAIRKGGDISDDTAKDAPSQKSTGLAEPKGENSVKEKLASNGSSRNERDAPSQKSIRLAELKGELAALDSKIQSERQRWQEAENLIHRLTNNHRIYLRPGTNEYNQCARAAEVIQEVEKGAPVLKSDKARLEATIGELGGK